MSSIWVVLLDISGSMDDGFSGVPSGDPFAERGRWRTKLDAAKELVLRQVASSRVQDVAVFAFSDSTEKLYHGARSDFSKAEATIRNLETRGETNLASAFEAVRKDPLLGSYDALSVVVLSDGLSNAGDPEEAAKQLIQRYRSARIDTILIDETAEGRRIAEETSINGSVRSAFSILDVGNALQDARASSLQQELAGFARRRFDLQTELSVFSNAGVPTLLTVTSPLELNANSIRDEIVPTLEGLESLQRSASMANGRPYNGAIKSISHDSPITVSLTGFKEAADLASEFIVPWRRKNAEQLAKLKVKQAEIDIEKARLENHKLEGCGYFGTTLHASGCRRF